MATRKDVNDWKRGFAKSISENMGISKSSARAIGDLVASPDDHEGISHAELIIAVALAKQGIRYTPSSGYTAPKREHTFSSPPSAKTEIRVEGARPVFGPYGALAGSDGSERYAADFAARRDAALAPSSARPRVAQFVGLAAPSSAPEASFQAGQQIGDNVFGAIKELASQKPTPGYVTNADGQTVAYNPGDAYVGEETLLPHLRER